MNLMTLLVFVLLAIVAAVIINPIAILKRVIVWKRKWREHTAQKYGEIRAQQFINKYRDEAQKLGIESHIIEQVIEDRYSEVVRQFGEEAAEELLGSPTFYERTL